MRLTCVIKRRRSGCFISISSKIGISQVRHTWPWRMEPTRMVGKVGGQNAYGSDRLTPDQKAELYEILGQYPEVLCNEPGKTQLIEHSIDTGSASLLRQPLYRVPYAQQDAVMEELKGMEDRGIIEPSTSEWSALTVVEKKGGRRTFMPETDVSDRRCTGSKSVTGLVGQPRGCLIALHPRRHIILV